MKIDPSQLRVSVEEQERWRRVMSVTVPASVVQQEERRAAQQLASRARMKGFRKGRVPTRLIEGRYAGALRQEALDKLIRDAFQQALEVESLRPISEGEIEDVRYEPQEDLTFSIAFDVQPVIEVERVGGFVVERTTPAVSDEHVDGVLNRIREQNGVWRPVDEGAPEDGNLVSVKILRLDDEPSAEGDEGEGHPDDATDGTDATDETDGEGRDYDFVLGQGDALPDIESAIKSLQPGGVGEFEVSFPEDFPDEARRGEVERVQIALVSRRSLDMPDLDDDLARQVGDFETLEDLRSRVREDMQKEADQNAESGVRSRLLDLLIEANPFEVPASMVERYADTVIGRADLPAEQLEELRGRIRPEAERAVKRILMVERVAETQGLAATEDELDERIEEIAEANDTAAAKVYAELQKSGRLDALERDLTEAKVFEFLKEQSEIIEAPAA